MIHTKWCTHSYQDLHTVGNTFAKLTLGNLYIPSNLAGMFKNKYELEDLYLCHSCRVFDLKSNITEIYLKSLAQCS